MEPSLSLEGTAGVCGVWGEIGFPGDEEEENVDGTIPGLLNPLVDAVGDCGCKSKEDDIESASAECDSRIL